MENSIDSYWEYSDPEGSEDRFKQALESASGDYRLELLTQIARTYSLRMRYEYEEAHQLLDEIEPLLNEAGNRPNLRYLLERGRTYNSSGDKERARDLFIRAWQLGTETNEIGLAVDAAHMVAITFAGSELAIDWNLKGLEIARPSVDAKARSLIPAMLNNSAWDLHDMGRYDQALPLFEEALTEWVAREKPTQIQIAKWSVARCLRSLKRHEDALAIQRELEAEHANLGTKDGYVFEEIAENLQALDRKQEARPYFSRAYDELRKDEWLVENEGPRLESLKIRVGRFG
jgi:tetratricopeptide (TPR) repeat protein